MGIFIFAGHANGHIYFSGHRTLAKASVLCSAELATLDKLYDNIAEYSYAKDWKAFREQAQKAKNEKRRQQETKVSYSLNETTDGRYVAVVDVDILSHIDTAHWTKEKRNEAKKAAKKALRNFKDGIIVNGVRRKVNNVTSDEYTGSNYTYMLYKKNKKVYADKMRAASVIDDVIEATVGWKSDDGLDHPRNDNFVDFEHGSTLIMSGDAKYSADVAVGITDQGERVVYDMTDIVPADFELKKRIPTIVTTQEAIDYVPGDSFNRSLADSTQNVKENFSLNDNTGNRNYQAELYELQRKRTAMLEADEAYRKAEEQRKRATTFSERVEASRALKEAKAKIDTIEIDQRISELRGLITAARDEKDQRHRREQEQYADSKTENPTAPATSLLAGKGVVFFLLALYNIH